MQEITFLRWTEIICFATCLLHHPAIPQVEGFASKITHHRSYFVPSRTLSKPFGFQNVLTSKSTTFSKNHDPFGNDGISNNRELELNAAASSFNQQLGTFDPLLVEDLLEDDDETTQQPIVSEDGEELLSSLRQRRRVRCFDLLSSSIRISRNNNGDEEEEERVIAYRDAWDFQKRLLSSHLERLSPNSKEDGETTTNIFNSSSQWMPPQQQQQQQQHHVSMDENGVITAMGEQNGIDSILMLQHEPVYTLGTGSDEGFIKDRTNKDGTVVDVVRVERGGEVTYHGPGQLVVYPILDLRGYRKDIHWYMRALEEAIIIALKAAGVHGAERADDVTGVWVNGKKVAALGVKARRWVTMHGLAVNVDQRSLANFEGIVPCGLEGRKVACINDFLDEPIDVREFSLHIKEALECVFQTTLVDVDN